MKTLLLLILTGGIFGCVSEKEIQMNFTMVELVKIDTVRRYPNNFEQVLTWRSEDKVDYITFEPLSTTYALGTRLRVLLKR
jgi:hypothetical protein